MLAKFMKSESDARSVMWEVRDGDRWWVVAFLTANGEYVITNETGRGVSAAGKLGKAIIAATKR